MPDEEGLATFPHRHWLISSFATAVLLRFGLPVDPELISTHGETCVEPGRDEPATEGTREDPSPPSPSYRVSPSC